MEVDLGVLGSHLGGVRPSHVAHQLGHVLDIVDVLNHPLLYELLQPVLIAGNGAVLERLENLVALKRKK